MPYNLFTFNFNIKKYKALFVGSTLVCLFLSIMLIPTSLIVEQLDSNSYIGKSISENPDIYNEADVIIIGDSRANQGIDCNVLEKAAYDLARKEIKAYNLGRPGMQAPFTYLVFADYIHNVKKKPKVLIMNISFYLLGGMQWMKDIYFSYYTPKLWQVIHAYQNKLITAQEGIKWYLGTRIPFIRYRSKLKTNILENLASNPEKILSTYSDTYLFKRYQFDKTNKGYLSNGSKRLAVKDMDASFYDNYKKGTERGYSVYLTYLRHLFDLAAKYKIHVLIYEFPWPILAEKDNFIEILSYYQKLIKELAGNNSYVHFVDYPYFWECDKFIDPLHLNQFGANELSSKAASWATPFL